MSYIKQLEEIFPPRSPEESAHKAHRVKVIKECDHRGNVGKIVTTQTGANKMSHLVELPDGACCWFQEGDLIECHKEGPGD